MQIMGATKVAISSGIEKEYRAVASERAHELEELGEESRDERRKTVQSALTPMKCHRIYCEIWIIEGELPREHNY